MNRRAFASLAVLLAVAGIASNALAGDLILRRNDGSYHRIPLNTVEMVSMEPGQRSMVVTPTAQQGTAGDGWCPSTPPTFTVSFTITPHPASPYQTLTANWTTANATSCSSSGTILPVGVTSLTGWTAALPTSATNRQVTLNKGGTYIFKISCTGAGGTVSAQKTILAA